jgi:adenylate cyclase
LQTDQFSGEKPSLIQTRAGLRQNFYPLIVLAALCLIFAPLFVSQMAQNPPKVKGGQVTFEGLRSLDKPVELEGDWVLNWHAPLKDGQSQPRPPMLIRVPGAWEGKVTPAGDQLTDKGSVTYSLTIKYLPPGMYRLYVPTIFGASRISINGRVMSTHGKIGSDGQNTRHFPRSHDIPFDHDSGDITVAIDVATFLVRSNGIEAAPVVGLSDPMQTWFALRWAQEFMIQVSLIVLMVFSMVVFLFRRTDLSSLFVALNCLGIIPISLIVGFDNLYLIILPNVNYTFMWASAYIGGYLALLGFLSAVHLLFRSESSKIIFKFLVVGVFIFSIAHVLFFVMFGLYSGSAFFVFTPIIMIVCFCSIFYTLISAAINGRDGAAALLIGMGAAAGAILMVALVASGGINPDFARGVNYGALGTMIFLFAHLVVLAERWSQTISLSEKMNEDLRQLLEVNSSITSEMELEALLVRIVQVTTRILGAERSSLFLFDGKTSELWSLVAEGVTTREIRIDSKDGLVGACFTKGEIINVQDVYTHPLFKPEIDEQTKFKSNSILSMPITARDGRKLGVMQALNRKNGNGFDLSDVARMRAFAAQAAIALDNASLFSEVLASKNYNDSILQSMSSGVVTLQNGAKEARLNDAAARILGITRTQAESRNARRFLERTNPWIMAEIDAVGAGALSKEFFDHDLITGRGEKISANLSIVPLHDVNTTTGVLLMIDDISSNKRLEGAMRRFMTQEVMDQVLAQKDELLFGSACDASVLFADIRNFTTMAEKLSPRDVVVMLNEIFTDLFDAVSDADGVLDKYIGDAVMAVFGAPLATGRDATNAVASALRMQEMIAAINTRRLARGDIELRLGVGISSGEVIAGTIGSPKRMDYTVIGDSVNLAARLQDITKTYGVDIIICEATANQLDPSILIRELDEIKVKGRERAERIYEVLIEPLPDGLATAYARGRAAFAKGNRDGAVNAFRAALKLDPDDGPSAFMLGRAEKGDISR